MDFQETFQRLFAPVLNLVGLGRRDPPWQGDFEVSNKCQRSIAHMVAQDGENSRLVHCDAQGNISYAVVGDQGLDLAQDVADPNGLLVQAYGSEGIPVLQTVDGILWANITGPLGENPFDTATPLRVVDQAAFPLASPTSVLVSVAGTASHAASLLGDLPRTVIVTVSDGAVSVYNGTVGVPLDAVCGIATPGCAVAFTAVYGVVTVVGLDASTKSVCIVM